MYVVQCFGKTLIGILLTVLLTTSAVDSGGAGGARAPREFGGLEKGRSLTSAYRNLAITSSTSGFEKLSSVLQSFLIIELT